MYTLSRQVGNRREILAFDSFDPSNRSYNLTFKDATNLNTIPVLLNFTNLGGFAARFLVTDQVYFTAVPSQQTQNSGITNLYIYATSQPDRFLLTENDRLSGRLILFFPAGTETSPQIYLADCNLNGHFFIHGNTLNEFEVAPFNSELTDMIKLTQIDNQTNVLAQDCTPNCFNRLCTDHDGCGLPCGCPNAQICLSSGQCVPDTRNSSILEPLCTPDSLCGDNNGQCYGRCPDPFKCIRDQNGRHFCQRARDASEGFRVGFFLLLIFILAIIIILVVWWLLIYRPVPILSRESRTQVSPSLGTVSTITSEGPSLSPPRSLYVRNE